MPEQDNSYVAGLKSLRDKLRKEFEEAQRKLALCEEALAQATREHQGKAVAKGRIISIVKDFILEHGASSYDAILAHVSAHGGIPTDEIETRLKQSLSRSLTAGTMIEKESLYDLTARERERLQTEDR